MNEKARVSQIGETVIVSIAHPTLPSQLSASERGVVRALLAGCSNAEIAAARGTTVKTVSNQLNAIYRKLGVRSRYELVAQLHGSMGE